jgi:CPA2 family monovalent cation:H+ antiporter-2
MAFWQLLMEIVLLLGTAFVLGAVAQRFKQSAIIGYLLAGMLMGPLLFNTRALEDVAELGVALLLFSIGLEFSFGRLKRLGRVALAGGSLQVVITLAVFTLGFLLFKPLSQALVLGAIVALSSTAVVLRVLVDRAEIDAVHGRTALGILLLQDIAVVPLVLMVTIMARGGEAGEVLLSIARTLAAAGGLVAVYYLIFYWLVPKVLITGSIFANRELMTLLAIIAAAGSTWCAHALGLSPALGAFLAGMLLGESPFAAQIRSDVGPLRTLFVTLFFTSIGMLMDPIWLLKYGSTALAAVAAVICGKTAIIYLIGRVIGINRRYALASGLTLSQIGEFSFVLATTAHASGLIQDEVFALVVTVNILSIFTAPYLVSYALPLADFFLRLLPQRYARYANEHAAEGDGKHPAIIVIGYGPAGRQVSEALQQNGLAPGIIELNPAIIHRDADAGLHIHIGDATSTEVLIHAGVPDARAVIVTIPDPRAAHDITAAVRALAPATHLLVRSRFQRSSKDLEGAGASTVVDEEITVGRLLAHEALTSLELGQDAGLACALAGRSPDVKAAAKSDTP